jgi:hypothetical protein
MPFDDREPVRVDVHFPPPFYWFGAGLTGALGALVAFAIVWLAIGPFAWRLVAGALRIATR